MGVQSLAAHHNKEERTCTDEIRDRIVGERIVEVPAASNRNVPVVVAVDYGAAPKGSNKIYFEVRSMANDAIAVREKATFFMP